MSPSELLEQSVRYRQLFDNNMTMYCTACFCDEKHAADIMRQRMHTLLDAMLDNVYLSQQMIRGGYEQDQGGSSGNPE